MWASANRCAMLTLERCFDFVDLEGDRECERGLEG